LASGSAHIAVSDTGTLAYVPGPTGAFGDSRLAIADRAGTLTPLPIQAGTYVDVRASRDGAHLAIGSDNGKDAFVSVYDLAGTSEMRRLTFADRSRFPIWSPTGEEIAYQSDRGGELSIFSQRADGTGPVRRLTTPAKGEAHVPESWAPDGKHISFAVIKGSGFSLWMLDVEKGTVAPFGDVQSTSPIGSVFSPDGHWLAYTWNPGVANPTIRGVYIQRFPAGERYLVPKNESFDFQPVWSSKGRNNGLELLYVPTVASGKMVVRSVTTTPGVTFENPQTIPARVTGGRIGSQARAYDILPDGRFVGPIRDLDDEALASGTREQIHVVVNWTEELKTRVPTNK